MTVYNHVIFLFQIIVSYSTLRTYHIDVKIVLIPYCIVQFLCAELTKIQSVALLMKL